MSARLNFQFFSGSSMRARKRLRCSSFERWRKNLTMRVPLTWRCLSRFAIERYRSCQIALSSLWRVRDRFAVENLGMHADDQHLLVIGAVEDADPPALRQIASGAPEKIVLQFGGARMFEAEDLAALRIDARHHVLDGAIFAGRIHRLEDQQDARSGRMHSEAAAARLVAPRAPPAAFDSASFDLYTGSTVVGHFPKIDFVAFLHAEVF